MSCDNSTTLNFDNSTEYNHLPFSKSPVYLGVIDKSIKLTQGSNVKNVFKLSLNLEGIEFNFKPGDTISIIPQNHETELNSLFLRLNIEKDVDKICKLEISNNSSKKLPKHLPKNYTTLRNIFLNHLDIRSPPKKLFLKALLNYVKDKNEKIYLEEIISTKGSDKYFKFITESGKTLIDLLNAFPSCYPPVSILLENLSVLQPRVFSISSSPFQYKTIDLTFSVVNWNDGRKGICTGWLENSQPFNKIPFYFRISNDFYLPDDSIIPIIMIATGTGIAPFRSFFQHRQYLLESNVKLGEAWLIFGCRNEMDYLYKNDIEEFLRLGVLSRVNICFSRENNKKYYVQNCIEEFHEYFIDLLLNKKCTIYICGIKNVISDVKQSILNILIYYNGFDENDARNYLSKLEEKKQLKIDSWI